MTRPTTIPTSVVDEVIITSELARRPARSPDFAAENRALVELATVMAQSPATVFQKLAESALMLCRAGSAGVSVWEPGEPSVFRWRGTAGAYASYLGGTLPRDFSPCGIVLDRNAAQLMADPVRIFPYLSELQDPVREVLLVPFFQGGKSVGTIWVVAHTSDHHFDAEDARIVTSLTRFAEAAVQVVSRIEEAERAEIVVRASEERFRSLFDSMDQGFCVIEVTFDPAGTPTDFRFVELNPAFGRHSGLENMIGKSIRDAVPGLEEFWFETYAKVAATGESIRFVHQAVPLDRWFEVYAFRLRETEAHRVGVLFTDVSEQKRAEGALQANAARHSMAIALSDAIRPLSDPVAVQSEASRVLGERLGAERVVYFEVRGKEYVVEQDYSNGVPSVVGRHTIASFGPAQFATYRSGQTAAEADVDAFPSRPAEEKAAFAGVQIRSYIGVPLVKNGVFVAGLAVHASLVREWTPDEIAMTEDTAERTWAAVERVRAEAALRASEERRRLALDAAELGTWHIDVATRRTKTDRRFRAILGTVDEWTDYLQLFALTHPDDLPDVQTSVAAALRPDNPVPYAIEYRIIHPNGDVRWIHARGRATFEEGATGKHAVSFDGTVADITERRRLEKEREDGRRTLNAIIERCPFGIYIVDADFRIASMNANSQDGAFVNVRPVIGRPFDEAIQILWPEEVAADIIGNFRRTLTTGTPYYSRDFINPRADKDQTERYEWELHQIILPDGRAGVVCYYYDSTKLRDAEQQLKEADRRKDEFLATLAHELRNPLAPIRNALHVARLAPPDSDAAVRSREVMERQVNQMVRLIDDLLEISRISQGKMVLKRERTTLAEAIRSAVEVSGPLIESQGHQLTVGPVPAGVVLDADPTRLTQVLLNLLNNAAKYTERGGRITVISRYEDGWAVVSVRDTGIGIPVEMLPKVFDLFTQVDRSLEKAQGGLGIGLALVQRLVAMHGGTVDARSEGIPGRGSEFVVRLPAMLDESAKSFALGADDRATPATSARRILIADDNVDSAASLAALLRLLGNEVRTAKDGAAAVEMFAAYQPDLALLDIGMPNLNGYDACRRIRELPSGKQVVLIALTGWGNDDDRRLSAEAGFDHHLVKPVDLKDITRIVGQSKLRGN